MIVYTLEQRCQILRHYFENHVVVAECARAYEFWKKRSTFSSACSLSCEKKWKKLASSAIHHSVKSQKQCVNPWILLLWHKVCVKRHQHQFTIVFNNWTFRRHHWDEFCKKVLVWCHIKFVWFRSWSQLTIQCVFASLSRSAIDLQRMLILAKTKSWSSFWSWRVCKQAKLSHLGHREPACIH